MKPTPLEIALERIEECRRTRSTALDLSGLGLDEIPEQVFELTWLEKLKVSGSPWEKGNIRKIPAAIEQLIALIDLNCSSNQISDLNVLAHVPNLLTLDCSSNPISDLSALAHLPNLQTLQCGSNQISDLSALAHVPNLQTLQCWDNQISDLSALAHVPNLQTLQCWDNQISDLSALAHVPNLQTLSFGGNQINSLSALAHVPNLQTLGCGSNQISDLSALAHVPNLQTLDCSSSNSIRDFSALAHVPNLQTLRCWNNQISDLSPLVHVPNLRKLYCSSNPISDLSPLVHVPNLQTLQCWSNQISDLSPLVHVPNLQTLQCWNNQISDLSPLAHVPNLQILQCWDNQISDLCALAHVPNLQTLSFGNNQISDMSPIYSVVMSEQLQQLSLYGNPACGIPSGILGNHRLDDCLENLKNYWHDLDKGKETQRQLKVQFVGNGRVGKTTLAHALEHKRAPCKPFKSTHGIVIKEIQQALDGEDEPVTLQLWDFGGQEIYHATHRLFLSDDCLYLLLWAEETEEHSDETRHPVSYWLESIHDLAPNSPVILVKNQIDRSDRLPERPAELNEELPGVSQIRYATKVSAMQYRGIPALRGAIESVLEELKYRVCLELPASWLEVQRALIQLHEQKTLPFAHFKQLCIKAGVSHAEWFAGYLHKTGVLFYREGAFQDQIILDQNWAINAVYRAFDPNKPHRRRIERMGGRFSGEDASLFWAEEDTKEQEVYVDFMRNCGICYEPKREQNQEDNKSFAEREFIIPALLPLTSKAKTAWGNSRPDDWQLDIEYPFLHRSIIERIILRIGETYEGEPWRTGIFCETDEAQLLLECEYANKQQSTQGRLRFQLRGNQPERLVYALRKLVSETSPHRRYHEYLSKAGTERTLLPEFKDEAMQHPSKLDASKPVDKTIKLFISYSHADEAHKERLEKHLKAISRTLPLTAWSDRHLFAGEAVDEQIFQQLNTADIVLLLVSPDFINSDYCFTKEMERALERYKDEGNVVIPVIIRHTASWRNHKIGQIVALPKDGKPLAKWDDADEFWGSVEDGIRDQVNKCLQA
ncbi:TIR domain-containing protein [Thiothrix subterranea]|uniref:leucine-rich repeat domain-containing protein n=1 Tax=Thiothrix subterranea TaxID=2735563 RepID=UPI00192B3C43|nr:leucine-rich repeat domain-containing protein [Thiothrix subterranea]QQZ28335.1 TIR domain-containing protein [Thiothrix subterranea]